MIVIAIIAIIAAIAIPNLLDARKAANETSMIGTLRTLHSAQNIYREQDKDGNGTLDYSNSLKNLYDQGLIDSTLEPTVGGIAMVKHGYYATITDQFASMFTWSSDARAEELEDSGLRRFYVNQTGVIRYSVQQDDDSYEDWPAIGK